VVLRPSRQRRVFSPPNVLGTASPLRHRLGAAAVGSSGLVPWYCVGSVILDPPLSGIQVPSNSDLVANFSS